MAYLEYNVDPTVAAISALVTLVCLALAPVIARLFGLCRALAG